MFTQRTEYGLRAMVWLARSADTGQTTEQIAEAMQAPGEYLFKILRRLSRAGLVHAQRGKGGGVTLARPPTDITVLAVVTAIDPIERVERCPLGLAEHRVSLCPLHRRLDAALAGIEEALRQTTLAEIAAECLTEEGSTARPQARRDSGRQSPRPREKAGRRRTSGAAKRRSRT